MYVGPIYTTEARKAVCPWCIAEGRAAVTWGAKFNDVRGVPHGVPEEVRDIIAQRTPGFETWQGNEWLFSDTDALVFEGEISGAALIAEGKAAKIAACRSALAEWNYSADFDLREIVTGGQPAVYLFRDRDNGRFRAYADMT